ARVSYVDPQANPDTRTAQFRVEVLNRNGELKVGMYTDMSVGEAERMDRIVIPRSAIQNVADRTVVYVAAPQTGRFTEREVKLGETVGDNVTVESGIQTGDRVVAKGSFALRAERERLGLRRSETAQWTGQPATTAPPASTSIQTARVIVSDQGYE